MTKVYHGTTPKCVDEIIENGIQPRGETGRSNWDAGDMQSIAEHVYLSAPFAPFYGLAASESTEIALIEVDLDALQERELYPDEDFVEQAIRSDELDIEYPSDIVDMSGGLTERTASVRDHIELFQPYWKSSLDVLGNVSHRGEVPCDAITRVVVADLPNEISVTIDPTIEIHAVQATRSKYETLTELLVGGDVSRVEYLAAAMGIPVPDDVAASDVISEDDVEAMTDAQNMNVDKILEQEYVSKLPHPTSLGR